MTKSKQHEGRIDIVRMVSNKSDDFIQVRLRDAESGRVAIEIQMTVEDFGLAITGLGSTPCAFELLDVGLVGKRMESKTAKVFVADGAWEEQGKRIRDAVAVHEEDGWQGRDSDAQNHHKITERDERGAWYNVQYTRYVEIEEEASS